ncbi:MAG: hypothetical protein SGILL_001502 [Bacillariaceae sp.]
MFDRNSRRLQNTILAVGPGTPASVVASAANNSKHKSRHTYRSNASSNEQASTSSSSSSSSNYSPFAASRRRMKDSHDDDEELEEKEEDMSVDDDYGSTSDSDEDESSRDSTNDDDEGVAMDEVYESLAARGRAESSEDEGEDSDDDSEEARLFRGFMERRVPPVVLNTDPHYCHSMRHGGCINTAAWLNTGWKLSTVDHFSRSTAPVHGMESDDCPTQLVTSGDDQLVKFWDVREAMGDISPLSGGRTTICPFSDTKTRNPRELEEEWESINESRNGASTESRSQHTGFNMPGSVRLMSTLHSQHRANVFHVTPVEGRPGVVATCGADGFLRLTSIESEKSSVVINPELEDENSGMLPAGLLRLRSSICYSHHFMNRNVGVLCSERGLRRFDIRLPPREQSKQRLLSGTAYHRQELLVSYESDQIYTFPIFPKNKSKGRSIMSQVEELEFSAESSMGSRGRVITPLSELATYGAHLNRFTFLKNARYAGPRDEYICTGSDSGHAWVYEKSTGTVSSFWMADNSTCNGVIPHPTLPVFVTYGIDSTAKLWRSTVPVNRDTDDSVVGRRQHSRIRKYEMSPTVRSWDQVECVLENLDLRHGGQDQTEIFPDHIPSTKVLMRRGRLARTWMRDAESSGGGPRIGNDLLNLERTLKDNLFTCLRSLYDDDDVPVESDIDDLKHRVSLIRLRYQADRLGLRWNLSVPWMMESEETASSDNEKLADLPEDHHVGYSDLVPDYPSDWVPNDPEMSSDPFDFGNLFNVRDYADFYGERYMFLNERHALQLEGIDGSESGGRICGGVLKKDHEKMDEDKETRCQSVKDARKVVGRKKIASLHDAEAPADEVHEIVRNEISANDMLLRTICALKDGGNAALKAGHFNLAAHRYDKAIQYAAMIYMKSPDADGGEWNQLKKTLVISRLNLALLFLKPHFCELKIAANQAKAALRDLSPFERLFDCDDELIEARDEILSLQAKAYFRLGTAQFEMGDYDCAIESFTESMKRTRRKSNHNSKPDQLLHRRLAEAKREQAKLSKRQRKKFKRAFASTTSPLSTSPPSPAFSSASSSIKASGSSTTNNAVSIVCTESNDIGSSTQTTVVSNKKSPPPGAKSSGTGEKTARA